MSFDEDLTARIIETRTELGIRRAADALGVNPQTLVDSRTVQSAVGAIDLQAAADVDAAIADAIKPVIDGAPQRFGIAPPTPPAAAPSADEGPRQWTIEDVNKSSPSECSAAIDAGLLRDLGYAPSRTRRRR